MIQCFLYIITSLYMAYILPDIDHFDIVSNKRTALDIMMAYLPERNDEIRVFGMDVFGCVIHASGM